MATCRCDNLSRIAADTRPYNRAMTPSNAAFLRLLSNLRWIAIACQVATATVVIGPLGLAVAPLPLWGGIAALMLFNVYAAWRTRRPRETSAAEAFAHIAVDVAVLTWLIAWNGGIANPFTSLFLMPIAFAALALPLRWMYATAALCGLGYLVSMLVGVPLPHVHGAGASGFDLHLWGMVVNFVISAGVALYFLSRLASAIRDREHELSRLRERFARNEGIMGLATHAASVAHELNTPLGSMTLMLDDLIDQEDRPDIADELRGIRAIVDVCRDRVQELALPANAIDGGGDASGAMEIEGVIDRWLLVRPAVQLLRSGNMERQHRIPVTVAHLLQVLLNNAADASQAAGSRSVALHLDADQDGLRGWIRDHGAGLSEQRTFLPGTLFSSGKPGGLGIGLALSHATVERLGGTLSMRAAEDGAGLCVDFSLPTRMEH